MSIKDIQEKAERHEEITVVLPFPMPTLNRLFSCSRREHMKLKRLCKECVQKSLSFQDGTETPTQTTFAPNTLLMALSVPEYLKMIRPPTSKASKTVSKLSRAQKLSKRFSKFGG